MRVFLSATEIGGQKQAIKDALKKHESIPERDGARSAEAVVQDDSCGGGSILCHQAARHFCGT